MPLRRQRTPWIFTPSQSKHGKFWIPAMAPSVRSQVSGQCHLRSSCPQLTSSCHHPEPDQPFTPSVFLNSQAFPSSHFSWKGSRVFMENGPFPRITTLHSQQDKLSPSCLYHLGDQQLQSSFASGAPKSSPGNLGHRWIFLTSFDRILEKKGKVFPDRMFFTKP